MGSPEHPPGVLHCSPKVFFSPVTGVAATFLQTEDTLLGVGTRLVSVASGEQVDWARCKCPCTTPRRRPAHWGGGAGGGTADTGVLPGDDAQAFYVAVSVSLGGVSSQALRS